jgi:hypothetical protein
MKFQKILDLATKNGFIYCNKNVDLLAFNHNNQIAINVADDEVPCIFVSTEEILFNHDFLKAIYGKDNSGCDYIDRAKYIIEFPTLNERIKYLEETLK